MVAEQLIGVGAAAGTPDALVEAPQHRRYVLATPAKTFRKSGHTIWAHMKTKCMVCLIYETYLFIIVDMFGIILSPPRHSRIQINYDNHIF